MQKILLCCAEGRERDWEAICLDLDIAVQGSSFDEVYHSLNDAIALYQDTVENLPAEERANLVERPAPLRIRLKFLLRALRALFRGRGDDDSCSHQYTVPCAV